ncbi:1-acylglycerol-3-phosphate O-acyltransferase [Bacillus carboniphilus]|uniref:1-acylglycerol-3-phosphate O-acyltransferase n=1 Tax=Bacillus carboniphilus TaxID=86663 RepID=A0ABN0W9F5_9BACI
MYRFAKGLARVLFYGFKKVEVKNRHLVKGKEGYVIACTHDGWLEIIALGVTLPKSIHYMAKKELFENRVIGYFLKRLNAFPVNRDNPGPSSLKTPIKLLKSGEVVGIFPHGTRTAEDISLKRGAVTIANLAKAPIVPAYYDGPNTLKELYFSRKKTTVIFGEPFYIKTSNKEEIAEYTDYLNEQFKQLKKVLEK